MGNTTSVKTPPRPGLGYAPPVTYLPLLLPDFLLILAGHLLCRFTALDRRIWEPTENLVYYCLFPVLLFHSIIRSPIDLGAASSLATAGLLLATGGIAMAYSLPRWPWIGRRIDRRLHAASAQIGFRFNSFIALALASRLAGADGLLNIAVLIGLCVPLLNVGAVWPMARHANKGFVRELARNPLIIATVSGLAANLLGLGIPAWLQPSVERVGQSSLALGLMAAGAGMRFGSLAKARQLAVQVLAIKHLGMPILAAGLAHALGLGQPQATALLLFSAIPTSSSCYVLAARMGYDGSYVAGLVTLSTVLGLVSIPLALQILAP